MPSRPLVAVLLAAVFAGCVANPGPKGFPGTEANPATGTFTIVLDDDSMMPKQSWVVAGTKVLFRDRQGADHDIRMENRGNASILVAANTTLETTWDERGDIRLVCAIHGDKNMRGWLHVV